MTFSTVPTTHINSISQLQESPLFKSKLIEAKAQFWHYFLYIHSIGPCGPSGQAELNGNDGILSLGCDWTDDELLPDGVTPLGLVNGFASTVGNTNEQAGTLAHELGHNLGLDHGGPVEIGGINNPDSPFNCKPNYISVMSYTRQLESPWLTGDTAGTPNYILDFSQGEVTIPITLG